MKKLLTLHTEYIDIKKLNKDELDKQRHEVFKNSMTEFKDQLKEFSKTFKVVEELPERAEVVIEFSEVVWSKLHTELLNADIVSIIEPA